MIMKRQEKCCHSFFQEHLGRIRVNFQKHGTTIMRRYTGEESCSIMLQGLCFISAPLTPLEFREEDHVLVLSTGNGGLELRFKVEVFLEQLAVGIIINDILVLKTYSPFLFPQTNIETLGNTQQNNQKNAETYALYYSYLMAILQGAGALSMALWGGGQDDEQGKINPYKVSLGIDLILLIGALMLWGKLCSQNKEEAKKFAYLMVESTTNLAITHLFVAGITSVKFENLKKASRLKISLKAIIFTFARILITALRDGADIKMGYKSILSVLPPYLLLVFYAVPIGIGIYTMNSSIFDALFKYAGTQVFLNIIFALVFLLLI